MATQKFAAGESWKTGSSLRKQRMSEYLEWYMVPESVRVPRTLHELAEQMGVSESTLWRYREDPWFQNQLVARRRGLLKVADAAKVIDNLVVIATDPNHKQAVAAARTLLEWMEKSAETPESLDLSTLTPEELIELAGELYAAGEVDKVAAEAGIDLGE